MEHVSKRYGGFSALDDVSLSIEEGEIFAILGRNGAGKTTLVECIEGLRRPDSGTITVAGHHPEDDELRHLLGAQLQESRLHDKIEVGEALDLYASFYRTPADWRELVEQVGLGDKIHARYATLSGGQKQRLSFALALVGAPRVVVLDELTTGLDPQARRDAWALVEAARDRGVTVILVTHFMEEAERLADRLALLDSGRLVALDTPSGLVDRLGADQRLSFRPDRAVDAEQIRALPEVRDLTTTGATITVTGSGHLVAAVTGLLARADIFPLDLRVHQATLDDAFVAFVGHPIGSEQHR